MHLREQKVDERGAKGDHHKPSDDHDQKLAQNGLGPASHRKVPTDPVLLKELGHEGALKQVSPVYHLPEHIHGRIELLLVCERAILAISQREGQIGREKAHHYKGEEESGAMDEVGIAVEFVRAGISDQDGHSRG